MDTGYFALSILLLLHHTPHQHRHSLPYQPWAGGCTPKALRGLLWRTIHLTDAGHSVLPSAGDVHSHSFPAPAVRQHKDVIKSH